MELRPPASNRFLLTLYFFLACSCARSPTTPDQIGSVDQLVGTFLARDFSVSRVGEMSPKTNGYFTVPSQEILVNGARVKAFEYSTSARADSDASLVSLEGQPNPRAVIDWIGPPHFYKRERLIVVYIGCATAVIQALQDYLGPPVAGLACK
jgi:hypothetical protein